MRITFVLPSYAWKPKGGFRVVYEYANRFVARGHEVIVVHPRRISNWNAPPSQNLYHWLRKEASHLRNLILSPKVKWQPIDRRVQMLYIAEPTAQNVPDAEIVFATSWRTAEYVVEYPASKGIKFYLIQHYEIWSGPKERVDDTWRMPLKKVIIAKWLYDKGIELVIPPNDMIHIRNGIDFRRFKLMNDIQMRPKQVAMMHHPAYWKGSDDGIHTLEMVRSMHTNLKAVLFGVVRKPQGLPSWIVYKHNPSQKELVENIYNGSRVFLCSSWTEGFSLPPAEAMACGCTVVATDSGGIREYAEHKKTALLSPPRNPEALAKNLLRVLEDDNLRLQLAKAGYEYIQEFTLERSTDLLEQFLLQYVEV